MADQGHGAGHTRTPDTLLLVGTNVTLLLICENISYSRKQGSQTREQNLSLLGELKSDITCS